MNYLLIVSFIFCLILANLTIECFQIKLPTFNRMFRLALAETSESSSDSKCDIENYLSGLMLNQPGKND